CANSGIAAAGFDYW
nr:immunoglobulin heavy chain junction region [Macaca mulatta]MOW85529.1 immunoglobulin heavy chain junction region [Macaca mulatta]